MSIAIVTDSTADIPAPMAKEVAIHVVPAILVMNGREFQDGADISRQEFYQQLPDLKSPPTTASPSAGTFEALYRDIFAQGATQILSIHAASLLSGIFSTACLAAKSFTGRVQVFDSQQLSLGLGFQVWAAAQLAAQGGTMPQLLQRVQSASQRIQVIAMLDTLEYLRRSGRVSWSRAAIGSLLNIKPLIQLRFGKVLRIGQIRTRRKGIAQLHAHLNALGRLEKLAILHSNAKADALAFRQSLTLPPDCDPLIINVTTVIGTHVGPNGLGFAALPAL